MLKNPSRSPKSDPEADDFQNLTSSSPVWCLPVCVKFGEDCFRIATCIGIEQTNITQTHKQTSRKAKHISIT